MATYDVYLQNRLTEIDVIISQLVLRDTFSIYNVMYLLCSLEELKLYKSLSMQTSMELDAKLIYLLKTVHELMDSKMYLKAKADLSSQVFSGGNVNLEMRVDKVNIQEETFTGGTSVLEMFTEPLDYYIAHSFGTVDFDMRLEMNQVKFIKEGFEQMNSELQLLIGADFSSSKIAELESIDLELSTEQINLFYLAVISGQCVLNLSASPLGDYILNKVLYGLNANMTLTAANVQTPALEKFANADALMQMLVSMTEILVQFIVLDRVDMVMSCEASAVMKQYRFVSEMDDYNVSHFDNMNVSEIDFKVID